MLSAPFVTPLLLVGLTACGGDKDDATQTGSGTAAGSDDGKDEKKADDSEKPVELDNDSALAAGISGKTAIKCVYAFNAEESKEMMLDGGIKNA